MQGVLALLLALTMLLGVGISTVAAASSAGDQATTTLQIARSSSISLCDTCAKAEKRCVQACVAGVQALSSPPELPLGELAGLSSARAQPLGRRPTVERTTAKRRLSAAALRLAGFSDGPALTLSSANDGAPHGRELSIAWLIGTVMIGVTSVVLMGAALYVSFKGQSTFSSPYRALAVASAGDVSASNLLIKTDRIRPVSRPKSEVEFIDASVREVLDGRDIVRAQRFVRVRATLATALTTLSADVPTYDPLTMVELQPPPTSDDTANTDIYGAATDGEVTIKTSPLPDAYWPPEIVTDADATAYVEQAMDDFLADPGPPETYTQHGNGVSAMGGAESIPEGMAVNVSSLQKVTSPDAAALRRTERQGR